jgi:hypothetical protein
MNKLTKITENVDKQKMGKYIYNKNKFLRDFSNLMENYHLKIFFQEYIKDDYDLYIFLNLCKCYNMYNDKYSPYEKVYLIKKLLDSKKNRREMLRLN